MTTHWAFVIAVIEPDVRPAQRSTVDFRTVVPTLAVPLTAVNDALGADGLLSPMELPEVTVTVYDVPMDSPLMTHDVVSVVHVR